MKTNKGELQTEPYYVFMSHYLNLSLSVWTTVKDYQRQKMEQFNNQSTLISADCRKVFKFSQVQVDQ